MTVAAMSAAQYHHHGNGIIATMLSNELTANGLQWLSFRDGDATFRVVIHYGGQCAKSMKLCYRVSVWFALLRFDHVPPFSSIFSVSFLNSGYLCDYFLWDQSKEHFVADKMQYNNVTGVEALSAELRLHLS